MRSHNDFILSPISGILNEVVTANIGIGSGIETFPLAEYVFQSAFLKMTGFQEQKMKCICWELATYDYAYRYKRYTQSPLGECSLYDEKKTIYKDLIEQIKKQNIGFALPDETARSQIRAQLIQDIKDIFKNSNITTWSQHSFLQFEAFAVSLKPNHFFGESNLLESNLQKNYKQLYDHRNRCAHNTLSYQQNLPTLQVMANSNYVNDNYFVRFALLMLIDAIFVRLYSSYLDSV